MRLGKAGVNIIQINRLTLYDQSLQGEPIRPKPELKIEDCKLNICGCRFAPPFLKSKEYIKYSIENIQYSIWLWLKSCANMMGF